MSELDIPPILISASPKSASQFITFSLAEMLKIQHIWIASPAFMEEHIDLRQIYQLKRGNAIGKGHFKASDFNISVIEQHFPKMLLHVRHPGQSVLSWVHNMDRIYAQRDDAERWFGLFEQFSDCG